MMLVVPARATTASAAKADAPRVPSASGGGPWVRDGAQRAASSDHDVVSREMSRVLRRHHAIPRASDGSVDLRHLSSRLSRDPWTLATVADTSIRAGGDRRFERVADRVRATAKLDRSLCLIWAHVNTPLADMWESDPGSPDEDAGPAALPQLPIETPTALSQPEPAGAAEADDSNERLTFL